MFGNGIVNLLKFGESFIAASFAWRKKWLYANPEPSLRLLRKLRKV